MKYFSIFLALFLAFTGIAFQSILAQSMDESERIWPPICTGGPPPVKCPPISSLFHDAISKPFDQSDNVLVGTVLQIENTTGNSLAYTIDVDFYLKNEQSFDLITATLDNPDKPSHAIDMVASILYLNSPFFDKNDLVFVYMKNIDGKYKVLPQSFVIEKSLRYSTLGIVHTSPYEKTYERGDDIIFSGIIPKAEMYQAAKKNKSLELTLTIYDKNESIVLFEPLSIEADGTYNYKFQTTSYPAGQYIFEMIFAGGNSGSLWDEEITIKRNKTYMTPLQQIKTGIQPNEVVCDEGLELILRHDDFAACVMPETKEKLIERGWSKPVDDLQKYSILMDILDRCDQVKKTGTFDGFAYGASWKNETHHIDTMNCKWMKLENEN